MAATLAEAAANTARFHAAANMPISAAMYSNIARAAQQLHQPQQDAMQAAIDMSKVLEALVPPFLRTAQSVAMQQEYDRQLKQQADYRAALYQKQANAGLPYQQNAGQAGGLQVPSPNFAQLGSRFYPSPQSMQQAAGMEDRNPYGAYTPDQYGPSSQRLPGRQQQQYLGQPYPGHQIQYAGQQHPQYRQSSYQGAVPRQ